MSTNLLFLHTQMGSLILLREREEREERERGGERGERRGERKRGRERGRDTFLCSLSSLSHRHRHRHREVEGICILLYYLLVLFNNNKVESNLIKIQIKTSAK